MEDTPCKYTQIESAQLAKPGDEEPDSQYLIKIQGLACYGNCSKNAEPCDENCQPEADVCWGNLQCMG
ncbi:hypothetical protein LCGC14_2921680, partial [marine sediment metagenome]